MRPTNQPSKTGTATKTDARMTQPSPAGTTARPFPVSNTNPAPAAAVLPMAGSQSDQIRAALDTLGIKLIKSEAEREVLKKLVEETRSTQQRLERELLENRKELSETRKKLDEQRTENETTKNRQERLEEKIRDSQQNAIKITRKLEADETRRARMQRRMERLESIADEAQQALQSRAMVLLTDRTIAEASGLPMLPAAGGALPVPAIAQDGTPISLDDAQPTAWWQKPLKLNTSVATLAVIVALGFGWMASQAMHNSQGAVAVLQDGSLARIDLRTGTLQPMQLSLKKLDVASEPVAATADAPAAETQEAPAAEGAAETKAEEQAAPAANAPVETPEKDASLTGAMKDLQDKAYAGVPEAQHDLAALYTAGQGVKQNYARAAYWFRQAANAGVANAAYNIGVLNHQGLGMDKNIDRALDWYRQAALEGHPEAQYNLGIAYIEGIGARYNPQLAAGFFQQAALSNITEAAYNLGLILENGLLGEPKPNQALIWYRVGAEGGSVEARNALEQLSERLGLSPEKAGFLADGTSLSRLVQKPERMETAADTSKTLTAVNALLPDLAELIPNRDQLLTAQVQEQLTTRGLYDGPEDGAMSPKTMDAIKTYQKNAGIDATGKADQDFLMRLLRESTAVTAPTT